MRTLTLTLILLIIGLAANMSAAGRQPNFVVILADDQGWAGTNVAMDPDTGGAASPWFVTPNLQRLAEQGIRFSNAYAPAARCKPSRAAIFTGQYPARLRLTDNGIGPNQEKYSRSLNGAVLTENVNDAIPRDAYTIGNWFEDNAPEYTVAHFGKWHVGRAEKKSAPANMGFPISDGPTDNLDGQATRKLDGELVVNFDENDPKQMFSLTDRAIAFLKKQSESGQPFYLQVSHYAVHLTSYGRPESIKMVDRLKKKPDTLRSDYAAMTHDLDAAVGRLLEALEATGLAENTYVIYTSDNGGLAAFHGNGPLQRGKSWLWEGGIRVPFIVKGPDVPANAVSSAPVSGIDIFPTVADLAGDIKTVPDTVDGGSLRGVIADPGNGVVKRPQEGLLFHIERYFTNGGNIARYPTVFPHSAFIKDGYKLIHEWDSPGFKGPNTYLYKLDDDVSESNNLAASMPERVNEMQRKMMQQLRQVNAAIPVPNPDYKVGGNPDLQRPNVGNKGKQ